MRGEKKVGSPNREKTITIKINGNSRPFKEEQKQNKQNEKVKSFKKKANENEIHERNEFPIHEWQSAAAKEPLEESFDWVLPELNETDPTEQQLNKKLPKKQKNAFKQKSRAKTNMLIPLFLTIFFAVGLGTGFGMIMLKLVKTDVGANKAIIKQEDKPVVNVEAKSTNKLTAKAAALSVFVIQEGVYSSKESAQKREAEMKSKDIPSQILQLNGKWYIFIGMASTNESAKTIGNQFESKGIKVYPKSIQLSEKELTNLSSAEKNLIELAPSLYNSLVTCSNAASLSQEISPTIKTTLSEQQKAWEKIDKKGIKQEKLLQIHTSLTSAVASWEAYEKKDLAKLNELQANLLVFFASYSSL